jgi:hypothetical protein
VAALGGAYHAAALAAFERQGRPLALTDAEAPHPAHPPRQALLCVYRTRRALVHLSAARFGRWDYACGPAHERSHWALGLGLPLFLVDPQIGAYAPLNHARLLAEGVALPLSGAADFGARLADLRRTGALARLAAAGWGRYAIDGFARAAEAVLASDAEAGEHVADGVHAFDQARV